MDTEETDKSLKEKKLSSTSVFRGDLLDFFKDEVELPDGETASREYVKHQGAAALLPVFKNGDVMLVRQYRYPLDLIFLEVPAGKIDADESPRTTAKRELKEETGISCSRCASLDFFYPSIGYTDEIIHLYVGWELEEQAQQIDQEEFLQKHRISFPEAHQMVLDGEITDSKTALILLKAAHWWKKEGPFPVKFEF